MFCHNCGNMLPERAKFCDSCGARVAFNAAPHYQASGNSCQGTSSNDASVAVRQTQRVGFGEAIVLYFKNYVNFSGRSRRSEYWYAFLFTVILNLVLGFPYPELLDILSLVLLCPNLALAVRRLHDTGKSGWYYFVTFVPIGGPIWMLIQMCKDSEGVNDWGQSPKY